MIIFEKKSFYATLKLLLVVLWLFLLIFADDFKKIYEFDFKY